MGNAGISMSWKKKVRRMAAKVAPTKLNAKDKNVDWKNWLANKKKERDGEGIEPTSLTSVDAKMSGTYRDKNRCSMCGMKLNPSHPATVTDPQTGLKYCRPCAKKKGLV